jgi:hypothetical protein
MAHLWVQDGEEGWVSYELDGSAVGLCADGVIEAASRSRVRLPSASAVVVRVAAGGGEQWALAASKSTGVRLNGLKLVTGLRVLSDRDEIRLPSGTILYFSKETLASVVAFPAGLSPLSCPRCRKPLEPGVAAVRCPGCGLWHHQSEEERLPCWTYAGRCAGGCDQPTELSAGYRWIPEAV